MKIYLVTMDWHYETHIIGAFETREKATAEIERQEFEPPSDGSYCRYNIQEMNLE